MRERVEVFGSEGGLVGILAEPDPGQALNGVPAVLLTDVGVQHRVGPYRIWVDLARRLADAGYTVLRFDLSGQGDSAQRTDARTHLERATADLREAMDHVAAKRGIRQFVVIGFCSGTDSAHAVAQADERVVGMVWIAGYAYRSLRFKLHWYTTRFLERRRWQVFLRRKAMRFLPGLKELRGVGEVRDLFSRDYPEPDVLSGQLEQLLARGVRILAIYAGGDDLTYGYAGQFFDMLPGNFRGRIDETYYPAADHLFTAVGERARLIQQLAEWVRGKFPAAEPLARTGT